MTASVTVTVREITTDPRRREWHVTASSWAISTRSIAYIEELRERETDGPPRPGEALRTTYLVTTTPCAPAFGGGPPRELRRKTLAAAKQAARKVAIERIESAIAAGGWS